MREQSWQPVSPSCYTYDGNGNLLTVKDAKNQTTTFAYDERNRLVFTTDPLGKTESYTYDGNDNLLTRITPKNETISFAYDVVNRLLSKTLPGNLLTQYVYDAVGNLTSVTDPDSSLTMTYDLANRVLTTSTTGSSNQPSVTVTSTYDKNGNRLTAVDPTGTNTYVYDVLNRLTSLTSPAGASTFAYDALSRRTAMTLPNGTQTSYSYDVASQITNILHKITATNTSINNADYLYNQVGNRTQLTDRRGTQAFGYDNLDRLTSATHPLPPTSQTFAYDAVGNRTSNGSLSNAGNQLTEDTQFTYLYDDNGNQTRKTNKTTNNFTAYTYDAENRLVKAEEFVAGNPIPTATSTYRHDGLGRRIEKVTPTGTKRYVYDGEDILLEYDGANVLQARYTHGPGIDEPIAVMKGNSTFFYHADGLGTITDLTDSSGATTKSYAYDAYGTIVEQTGTVEQVYTYTGRELDAETGLHYYRKRHYDPTTGRFLQKDPIGFTSGDANLYKYTKGNPVNATDPFGLTTLMFNIKNKTLTVDPERDGQAPYQLPATSGIGDCLNKPECARQRDSGPIPPGEYSIDTGEITNPGFLGDLRRNFLGDWGDWRVPIHPNPGTQTFGRGGFLLHGGRKEGSKGCIDVGGGVFGNENTNRLLKDLLNDPDHRVPLTVQ